MGDETRSFAEAAAELGITPEALYKLAASLQPAVPGRRGRNRGARLSRSQVEKLREARVRRLEEELRRARGEVG